MDQQRDPSEDESRSNLPSPALHPLPAGGHAHRTTNFFIERILSADFGRRRAQGPGSLASRTAPDSASSSASSAVSCPSSKRRSAANDADGVQSPKSPVASDSGETSARQVLWPAWVYCTRYSDRPSSGPRTRKSKKKKTSSEDKRPRTAFTAEQLQRLKTEFQSSRYITETRRQVLAHQLQLNESQIKIWFQNKRAKIKKSSGYKNGLALRLMAQGLYNHSSSTRTLHEDEEEHETSTLTATPGTRCV